MGIYGAAAAAAMMTLFACVPRSLFPFLFSSSSSSFFACQVSFSFWRLLLGLLEWWWTPYVHPSAARYYCVDVAAAAASKRGKRKETLVHLLSAFCQLVTVSPFAIQGFW